MEANAILSADILDIIFEGRYKDYGAYALRKEYDKRMRIALMTTAAVCLILLLIYFYSKSHQQINSHLRPEVTDVNLDEYKEKKPDPVIIPKVIQPQVATIRDVIPRIVKDDQVKKTEVPPEEALEDVKISTTTQEGIKDDVTHPPMADSRGVTETPKADGTDKTFIPVEIESTYPGGLEAWSRFLNKNLHFPEAATNAGIQGKVLVRFAVDEQGNTSAIEAVQGPDELKAEAVRVIKKSGQWTPAIQNGTKVKSYKMQVIIFQLTDG